MGTMERQQRLNVVARIEDILDRYFGEVACLHVSQESETTRDRNSEDATYPTVPPSFECRASDRNGIMYSIIGVSPSETDAKESVACHQKKLTQTMTHNMLSSSRLERGNKKRSVPARYRLKAW